MLKNKLTKYKPLYKKIISLKRNVLITKKFLKFKKRKWETFQFHFKNFLTDKRKRLKFYDHNRYAQTRFVKYFKNSYKYRLTVRNRLKVFYFNFKPKYIKSKILKKTGKKLNNFKTNYYFLQLLESRLDSVLYRSKFTGNIRKARIMIQLKKVYVNKKLVTISSFQLQPGDLIEIHKSYFCKLKKEIKNNFLLWPYNVNYVQINYRTFQIIFLGDFRNSDFYFMYPFWVDINSWIRSYTHK